MRKACTRLDLKNAYSSRQQSQRFVCLPYLFKMNTNYITYLHNALTFLEYSSICYQWEQLFVSVTHEETKTTEE